MAKDMKSPVQIGRVAIVLLGIVIMGVGLHSHFESIWREDVTIAGNRTMKYRDRMCETAKRLDKPCPHLSMERYFVAIVVITFIISVIGLFASFAIDLGGLKAFDGGYHIIAAILLMIAAIVYIVSSEQIKELYRTEPEGLRRKEKLAAGVLTIFHSLLYGIVACLIGSTT